MRWVNQYKKEGETITSIRVSILCTNIGIVRISSARGFLQWGNFMRPLDDMLDDLHIDGIAHLFITIFGMVFIRFWK